MARLALAAGRGGERSAGRRGCCGAARARAGRAHHRRRRARGRGRHAVPARRQSERARRGARRARGAGARGRERQAAGSLSAARVVSLGSAGFCVELGDSLAPETNARVRALDRELARRPFDGFLEAVPTLRSLLVLYDGAAIRPGAVARELEARLARLEAAPPVPGRLHELPTRYGGEDGPDLEALARG